MKAKGRREGWWGGGAIAPGVIVGVFIVAGVASAMTGANAHAAVSPRFYCPGSKPMLALGASAPAGLTRPRQVLSISWKVVDDEDGSVIGYWALDTYTISINVWYLRAGGYAGDYYWTQTESGIFQTFQGAHSPNNSAIEQAPGYGTTTMVAWGFVNNTTVEQFTPGSNPVRGYLGLMDYGGSTNATLAGTYAVTGDTNMWFWYTAYFTPALETDYTVGENGGAWGYVYQLNSAFWTPPVPTGVTQQSSNVYCIFGVPGSGSLFDVSGDIVTAA